MLHPATQAEMWEHEPCRSHHNLVEILVALNRGNVDFRVCHLAKAAGQGAERGRPCEQFRWQEIQQREKAKRMIAGDAVPVHGVVLLSSKIEPSAYNRHKYRRIVPDCKNYIKKE